MLMRNLLNLPAVPQPPERHPLLSSNSCFGIEIEIEASNRTIPREGLTNWVSVSEGSINGFELVLNGPKAGVDLYEALDELETKMPVSSFNSNAFSKRTSVHIHVDIRDMEYTQFLNFMSLCIMFEDVLYNYVASHRQKNHFCWAISDCQKLLDHLFTINRRYLTMSTSDFNRSFSRYWRDHLNDNTAKYAGINLSSVARYGSLEFRMHEGTIDVLSILRWINILGTIKEYSMQEGLTTNNILETKKDQGIESIFSQVLGTYSGMLSYKGVEDSILNGIRNVQDFLCGLTMDNTLALNEIPDCSHDYLNLNNGTSTTIDIEDLEEEHDGEDEGDDDDEDEEDGW